MRRGRSKTRKWLISSTPRPKRKSLAERGLYKVDFCDVELRNAYYSWFLRNTIPICHIYLESIKETIETDSDSQSESEVNVDKPRQYYIISTKTKEQLIECFSGNDPVIIRDDRVGLPHMVIGCGHGRKHYKRCGQSHNNKITADISICVRPDILLIAHMQKLSLGQKMQTITTEHIIIPPTEIFIQNILDNSDVDTRIKIKFLVFSPLDEKTSIKLRTNNNLKHRIKPSIFDGILSFRSSFPVQSSSDIIHPKLSDYGLIRVSGKDYIVEYLSWKNLLIKRNIPVEKNKNYLDNSGIKMFYPDEREYILDLLFG